MKALFWILIGISIIFLLCLPCLIQPIFENMDSSDAATIAQQYVENLTAQRDGALQNKSNAEAEVRYLDGQLTNAQKILDSTEITATQADRTRLIGEVTKSLTDSRTAYQASIADANNQLTIKTDLLKAATEAAVRAPLIAEMRTITEQINKYTKRVADATAMLTDATKLLTATPTPEDRERWIYDVKTINATRDEYAGLAVSYAAEAERFSVLITNDGKSAAELKAQAEADAAAAAADPTPQTDNAGTAYVLGPDGKMVLLQPTGGLDFKPSYYEPGTYKYGSSTYVPNYEDSIYLSRTTGSSSTTSYLDPATIKGGACSYYKDQPEKLEEMCLAVDKNNCGAMSCCVLLGGSKCVSGDAAGPRNKLNYGDITVRDKDYYYHDGKCYGNCKP
jgi:hypothetical protein